MHKQYCRLLLVASVFALLCLAAGVHAQDEVLFHDDFSGDLSNWYFDTGTDGRPDYFSISDGAMLFAPVWFGNAFAGDPAWTDYAVEVEYEVLEYGQYGNTRVFVRSNQLWYGYGVSIAEGVLVLDRFEGNWDRRTTYVQIGRATPPGQRVTVRLEVRGNNLKLYYNGEFLAEATDPDNLYPTGRIGLRADHDSIKVYRVTVTAL